MADRQVYRLKVEGVLQGTPEEVRHVLQALSAVLRLAPCVQQCNVTTEHDMPLVEAERVNFKTWMDEVESRRHEGSIPYRSDMFTQRDYDDFRLRYMAGEYEPNSYGESFYSYFGLDKISSRDPELPRRFERIKNASSRTLATSMIEQLFEFQ